MRRQQPQEDRFERIDDYEQPTEPMSQVILSPFPVPAYQAGSPIDQESVPTPQLDERPFPKQGVTPVDAFNRSPATPPVYPILPRAPAESRNGRPPGGTLPHPHPYARRPENSVSRQPRRSSFPAFVGLFFVAVELILLLRLAFLLFGISGNNVWVGLVYTISAIFVLPFRLLLGNVKIPILYGTDLYYNLLTIFALLTYGLLSRILVRFLKALLNSR